MIPNILILAVYSVQRVSRVLSFQRPSPQAKADLNLELLFFFNYSGGQFTGCLRRLAERKGGSYYLIFDKGGYYIQIMLLLARVGPLNEGSKLMQGLFHPIINLTADGIGGKSMTLVFPAVVL